MTTEGFTIRRGNPSDAAALAELADRTFRDAFAADNDPDDMAEYCAAAFAPEIQRGQIADPAIDTLVVADVTGRLVAYAQLRAGAAPDAIRGPHLLELWRFYVDRAHHGRGLAPALLDAAVEAAVARGAHTLWLGVWERNHRAQAFYRKTGFVDVGAHQFRLGRDLQTDRLMSRPLPAGAGTDRRADPGV